MTKQYYRYICNHIIFTVIIWLCVFVPNIAGLDFNEYGVYTYDSTQHIEWINTTPAEGIVYYQLGLQWDIFYCSFCQKIESQYYDFSTSTYGTIHSGEWACYQSDSTTYSTISDRETFNQHDSFVYSMPTNGGDTSCFIQYNNCKTSIYFFDPNTDIFSISGTTCGITDVSLFIKSGVDYFIIDKDILTSTGDSYSFEIINNTNYRIEFSDTHTYDFICIDNEVYNRDICDYQILHYVDDCANLLKNPCINIIVNDDYSNPLISDGSSHTDVFMIGDDIQLNDKLDVWIGTDQGEQYKRLYAESGENWLYHKTKSWDLNIRVYDINTSGYISGAKVSVKQECRINGYQPYTFGTTNLYGYVKTFDLSNQPYQVKVEKENYNTFGYTTINAGFDAQCTDVPLTIYIQDTTKGDGNGTIGDPPNGGEGGGGDTVLPQTECSILWTNNTGNSITEINDTQDARLYFMASNCSTTLTLESRDINTYTWNIEDTVILTPLQTGYVQYGMVNWTYPETKRYRGHLFAYDCGCDVTDDLKVWDVNDPNTTLINNLSAYVGFRHTIGSSYVNPSSPIKITSYAASNNTSLLNINLFLFNETVKVDEISYTFFDYYVNNQFKSINWYPNYQYTAGYRYSIYMYSNNILVNFDTVFANATGDNPFDTGNALTVKVYDHNGLPLQYSTVYVESWGSIDTGVTNEVIFTGLGDDTYEYRAIKSGYLSRGFKSVSLTADATVSYILDIIDTEHAIRDIRMSDGDVKDMLYPIVFFILILLLIGVLIDAVN